VFHRRRVAAVGRQILGKGCHGGMIPPRAGEQQAFGFQVMHDGEVFVAFLDAGLVDADLAHTAHVVLGTGGGDVVGNARPQPLGRHPQQASGLSYGQLPAQRQAQGFKQQGEAAAFPRPGHGHLAHLAAGIALNARYVGMQPGFELKKVQVPPIAPHPVMDTLVRRTAGWAGKPLGLAAHLEIDTPLGGVEFDLFHFPWRLQAQGGSKKGFNGQVHGRGARSGSNSPDSTTSVTVYEVKFHWKRHRANLEHH
jgi:hypothetical protein